VSASSASVPRARGRRWLRVLLWSAGIAVVLRLVLAFAAVPIARAIAARQGIALDVERLDLALLEGRVEAWRVSAGVKRADGGTPAPLASLDSLALDVDALALLRGHVRVRRLELDGGSLELARDADGAWNFAPLVERSPDEAAEEAEEEPEEPYEPHPIDLEPPIELVAVRAQDLSLHLVDAASDPPLDATLTVSLAATDVGTPGRRARLDVIATSPELLDLLRVRGTGTAAGAEAELDLDIELSALKPRPLAHLALPLGIEPIAERIDGGLALRLRAQPANEAGDRVALTAEVTGLHLFHDGREAVGLDALHVEAPEAWPRGIHVTAAGLEGARVRAERLADGATALAGIAFRGGTRSPGGAVEATTVARPTSAREPFGWSLDAVHASDCALAFDDHALEPTVETVARLEELAIGPLSSAPDAPAAPFRIAATVPDVVERIQLSGSFQATEGALQLALDAEGVGLRRIAPYLAPAGIEPVLGDGSLRVASLTLGTGAQGERTYALRGFAVSDGGTELAAIDSFTLGRNAAGAPDFALGGTRLVAKRDAAGAVTALGLRFGAAPESAPRAEEAAAAPVVAPSPARAEFTLPELALPSARVELERLTLLDETRDEPLEIGPLTAVLAPAEPSAAGARAYSLELDGRTRIAQELAARVHVEQAPSGALALAGNVRARGLELEPLHPWLALAGVEPSLAGGALEGQARVALAAREGRPALDLELGPLRLTEGADEHERFGLERLSIEQLVLGDTIAVDAIHIAGARLDVQHDADGGVRALGIRVPPPPTTAPSEPSAAAPAPAAAVAVEAPEPATNAAPALRIGLVELTGAHVHLEDRALAAPAILDLGADLHVESLAPGAGASPTKLDGRFTVGTMALAARGELVLDPDDLSVRLALSGTGLTNGPIAPWLPPGIGIALADGVARLQLDARVAHAAEGGTSLSVHVADVALGERDAERPVAAIAAVRIDASRIDPEAGVYAVEELALEGARLDVVRTSDGGVRALGVRLAPAPEAPDAVVAPEEPVTSSAEPATGAEPRRAAATRTPIVRLDRLALELAELRVTSEAHPEATPSVSSARLALREPFVLDLDALDEAAVAPKIGLDVNASVAPGIGSLALALDLDPLAEHPRVDATLAVRGIEGSGLLAFAPELAAEIDPAGMTEGTLDATLGAELSWSRRGPLDFDLGNGFGAEIELRDLALRRAPEEPIDVGVDRIEVLVRRVAPRAGLLHVSSLDIDTPHFHARRTTEGIDVAGIVLRPPAPDGEAVREPAAGEALPSDQLVPVAATTADAAPRPASELRVDSFVVHGVDARFDDATTDPPLALPLTELELDVRGFTTRALSEPLPVRFALFAGAGAVPLPVRMENSSLLRGLATASIGALSGKEEEVRYEERPLFEDLALTGRLTLKPPEGWIRCSTTDFELVGLRGPARTSGVDIGDGTLDLNTRVRLDANGGHVDSVSNFSHLSLSEPAGGPISRYLHLPAPLDTVLFALENEQGDHRIPLAFDFERGAVASGQVALEASKALLGLITEALAGLPLRAASSVTDVVGLGGLLGGGKGRPKYAGMRARVPFAAGGVHVGPEAQEELADVVDAMDEDKRLELDVVHVFGPSDLERAERLASPETNEAATLLRALRQRHAELARRSDELASAARVELLLGETERFAASRRELVEVERELGVNADGIDRVAELLRPRAESRRDRRTRTAALAIAGTRMDGVSRVLLNGGVPYSRITLHPPRFELPTGAEAEDPHGRIELLTRGGTPRKGFFRRILGWVGL